MFNIRSAPLAFAGFCVVTALHAQEWTRFRGPNGTGIGQGKTIPAKITDADLVWKIELPGSGLSSPVLWGEKLFITTTEGEAGGISVICLSAGDGKQFWRRDFALKPFRENQFNSFASSTPAVDAERVYVAWNEPDHYVLTALDHTGKTVWQRDFGPFVSQHGSGNSPVVYDNKVVLTDFQDDAKYGSDPNRQSESAIIAVDASSGKTVWKTPRRTVTADYSTPCLYEPKHGQRALIFNSQSHGIFALEPDTGKELWEFEKAFDKRSISSPVISGDIILGSCGSGGGGNFVTAIKAADAASGRKPQLAYQIRKSAPYVPTGVAFGDLIWLWSDGGIVACVTAATGQIHYQERVGGDFFGSPVYVDGRLYCVSTSGELVSLEASDKFNVLGRYPLKERCHSTPAVALGRLYIHTEKHLWSFGGPKDAAAP